jgi:hypothetical protein
VKGKAAAWPDRGRAAAGLTRLQASLAGLTRLQASLAGLARLQASLAGLTRLQASLAVLQTAARMGGRFGLLEPALEQVETGIPEAWIGKVHVHDLAKLLRAA